jgi:hypothetical protein
MRNARNAKKESDLRRHFFRAKKIAEIHIVETAWRKAMHATYDLENLNAPSWPSRSRIFGFRSCGTRW